MTPIGSTSSNIRRAIEFIVYSSCCSAGASSRALTITWTIARRQTHRTTPPTAQEDDQQHAAAQGAGAGAGYGRRTARALTGRAHRFSSWATSRVSTAAES